MATTTERERIRQSLIARANHLEREMTLDKNTAEHWNSLHPDEEPLNVDYSDIEAAIAKMRAAINNEKPN